MCVQTDIVIMQRRVQPHITTQHLHNERPISGCVCEMFSALISQQWVKRALARLLMKATVLFHRPVSQAFQTQPTTGLSTF